MSSSVPTAAVAWEVCTWELPGVDIVAGHLGGWRRAGRAAAERRPGGRRPGGRRPGLGGRAAAGRAAAGTREGGRRPELGRAACSWRLRRRAVAPSRGRACRKRAAGGKPPAGGERDSSRRSLDFGLGGGRAGGYAAVGSGGEEVRTQEDKELRIEEP